AMKIVFPTQCFHRPARLESVCIAAGLLLAGWLADVRAADGIAQASLKVEDLDAAAFAEWIGGGERAPDAAKEGPQQVLWTRNSRPDIHGVTFGESATPGARHLRIGLKAPMAAGSVLVRGGGQLSVLKAGAAYPGDLAREADWLPAERIKGAEVSRE